jgi:hypothetical protein
MIRYPEWLKPQYWPARNRCRCGKHEQVLHQSALWMAWLNSVQAEGIREHHKIKNDLLKG